MTHINRITEIKESKTMTADLLDTDCLAFVVIFHDTNSKEIFGLFQSQKYEAFL